MIVTLWKDIINSMENSQEEQQALKYRKLFAGN